MSILIVFSLLLASVAATGQPRIDYTSFKVYRLYPETHIQLSAVKELHNAEQFSFWVEPSEVGHPVDLMTSPDQEEAIIQFIRDHRFEYKVLLDDVEDAIQKENPTDPNITSRAHTKMGFEQYHRLSVIHDHLDTLAVNNPSFVKIITIGTSYENRPLKVIKIGGIQTTKKPAIWIDGGMHAREWVSPATVMYFVDKLINEYSTNLEVKNLVDKVDWYILPVANPDGYEYTHTTDRMWRKTRSRNSLRFCVGTDPNRNFGHYWNTGGASNNPCSEIYAGPKAFSEKETSAIRDFVLQHKSNIKVFLTFHAYSQVWLTPWGYSKGLPSNYQHLKNLAVRATKALSTRHSTEYTVGSSSNIMYIASGGSDDWALGVAGIKYSYTVELRDKGQFGFVLPAKQIVPCAYETWDAVKFIGQEVITGLP